MSIRFFTFFVTWGIYLPFWVPWLVSKGFSTTHAGWLMALGNIVQAISMMFLFPKLCERFKLSNLVVGISVCSLLIFSCFLIPQLNSVIIILTMLILHIVYPLHMPLNDACATLFAKEGMLDYGKSRSWGSVGYIFVLLMMGVLIAQFHKPVIVYSLVISCLFLLLFTMIGLPTRLKVKNDSEKGSIISLFKLPHFALCFFICFIIQGAHAAYYNYGVLYLQDLGVQETWTSILLALQIPVEILFFYISDRFFAKLPVYKMLVISIIFSIIRWLLVYYFHDLSVFIFSQLFHAITYALTHYAFIRFTNENIPSVYIPTTLGVYMALVSSLSTGILGLLAGWLSKFSIQTPFLGMAIVCLPCLFLCYRFAVKERGEYKNQ
jgi:PPP family 3-phenylpropionic acid transporter